jgi:hypothetical protein
MAWRTSLFKFNRKSGFFICLPLTIRFQSPVGGATNVTAEAFSKQAQDVVPNFRNFSKSCGDFQNILDTFVTLCYAHNV